MTQRRGVGCGCLGCGGSLLVLVVLAAVAWFAVIRPAQQFLAGWTVPQTQTTGTQTPGAQNGTTTPAPTGNAAAPLTQADVQKFVRVRRDVRTALGSSFTGAQQVFTEIQAGQTPNIVQVLNVLREVGGSIGAARTAQSAALAREGMSAERYAAVRSGVNRGLGLPDIDFAQAAAALQRGQAPDLNGTVQTATAQEKALVAPFRQELTATAAAGLLGL
ncbi:MULTISPECIES: hypothetical protein [Deinococcus]|uniref:Uncharacterized protein n=1 Tax=Deinococcus rufus TaxID=2136097 RepID=A0ABV7ZCA4_9DEIO|nr:hypothetical protein [Deinococcus sp. AB2017081]WQE95008.1 hypothetical protein U2P90_16695 [Deinococcus sp. AB2017081]